MMCLASNHVQNLDWSNLSLLRINMWSISQSFLTKYYPLVGHSRRRSKQTVNVIVMNTLMSTNIQIFKYSNKMALEYYSYSYLCHFPSSNIFGYSFVDFWTTKYIRIFFCKFLKIQIFLNICYELYFNICLSMFNEQW